MATTADTLTLTEFLKIWESGAVFSINFVRFDKKRRLKNGEILTFEAVRKESAAKMDSPEAEREAHRQNSASADRLSNGNQHAHFTRHIRVYHNGRPTTQVIPIHPVLIREVNGKRLLL